MSIQVCNIVHQFIYISRFHPIEMHCNKNEAIAIIGGNGCGKTTFLRLLLKDLSPKRGAVTIDGEVAFLGTKNYLKPQVTLKNQIPHFLNQDTIFPWPEFLPMQFQDLSKGQQRLISLWIIFQTIHPIILLDEPFTNLDTNAKNLVCEWINTNTQLGKTIVLTNHSLDDLKTINNLKILDFSY